MSDKNKVKLNDEDLKETKGGTLSDRENCSYHCNSCQKNFVSTKYGAECPDCHSTNLTKK